MTAAGLGCRPAAAAGWSWPPGALVGCAAGAALAAVLYLLVETAIRGPRAVRRQGRGAADLRRRAP
ncbi:hypothetical protein [Streptomyces regalis]|uniref:hypothetical protein n=1 Tax=Streptomyces regalis TaxID=68262 RepID=UPI00131DF2A8|nr:hypothetical protein [Streptomyces regalis]